MLRRLTLIGSKRPGRVACGLAGAALVVGACSSMNSASGEDEPPRVAPYVDVTLTQVPDLARLATSGTRMFNLAFITAGEDCQPTWGGVVPYDDREIATRIRELRAAGGDVRISFGGAQSTELAQKCGSTDDLAAAYAKVIASQNVIWVDYDVEGPALADTVSVRRRNLAIRQLQMAAHRRGSPLRVSYTLPADSAGLTADAQALLRHAHAVNVDVDAVNVMAMNYGTGTSQMGAQAIEVATSTQRFIRRLWSELPESEAWRKVAVTPMIGVNDTSAETFRAEDAVQLVDFARRHQLGWLSFWSLNRDQPCSPAAVNDRASAVCSGVAQRAGEFLTIFTGQRPL